MADKIRFFICLVSDGNPTNQSKFGIYEFFDFIFGTRVKYATKMGELLCTDTGLRDPSLEAAGEEKRCFCGSVYLYFPQ